ncbi:MAG: D-xylose ABC transporter ATP-binding protein [Actinobacteria bacterium HGW-Actinobacteria-5]|jgi:ribose transport system ATP-binding protein|nr:MAG: D-xylose ABC transporter ATP-binding protein [Actinobacteria bacterium HGW-Actinobacteria-5]
MTAQATEHLLLQMQGIGKEFPGVKALEGVHLSVRAGQVHALLGENGAGKSTLIKILSGAYTRDEGEILFEGQPVDIRTPADAERLGISTIYQEFNLTQHMTIAENIFLGHLPKKAGRVDWSTVRRRSRELLDSLDVGLDVDMLTGSLTVAQQQMVEIAKALNRNTRVLIMDEPSAVLGERDIERLFDVVRRLQASGIGIVYISHRLKEIFELADEVTVLKDGRYVDTRRVADVTMDDLVRLMVGRDLVDVFPKRRTKPGEVVLEVSGLAQPKLARDVSFSVRSGEIVSLAGITGSGRTEVARVIFGADKATSGQMRLGGQPYRPRSPRDAINHGVALVNEDRKKEGLLLKLQVFFNITVSGLDRLARYRVLRLKDEKSLVAKWIESLRIKTPGQNFMVVNMSGGNQQKVVLARWLSLGIKVFIMDEPTRGIDVGSKAEIYQIMSDLAEQGVAIIMISSELPEVLGMSDRVIVMREGRTVKEINRAEATEELVMQYAVGHEEAVAG